MAGASRTIEIDDEALRGALGRLAALGADMEPVFDQIGAAMVQRTQERFERGQGPGGVAWRPSIRAQHQGGRTLVDKAHLFQSLTHVATDTEAAWGTNVPYAGVHQTGATIRPKNAKALRFNLPGVGWVTAKSVTIPARPFIGFDAVDRGIAEDIVVDALRDAAEGGAA